MSYTTIYIPLFSPIVIFVAVPAKMSDCPPSLALPNLTRLRLPCIRPRSLSHSRLSPLISDYITVASINLIGCSCRVQNLALSVGWSVDWSVGRYRIRSTIHTSHLIGLLGLVPFLLPLFLSFFFFSILLSLRLSFVFSCGHAIL